MWCLLFSCTLRFETKAEKQNILFRIACGESFHVAVSSVALLEISGVSTELCSGVVLH